jgi:hypothetical protein
MIVYWLIFLLFTSLGGFVTWMFFHKLLWGSWQDRKRLKEYYKKPRYRNTNKGLVRIEEPKAENGSWDFYVFGIPFLAVAFIALPTFCFYMAYPTWLDLPRAITGIYAEKEVTIRNSDSVDMSGNRSWGYPYGAYIKGVRYSSIVDLRSVDDQKVTIKYLPHSKVITSYKRQQ